MNRGGSILRNGSYYRRIRKVVVQKGGHTGTWDEKSARLSVNWLVSKKAGTSISVVEKEYLFYPPFQRFTS